MKQRDDYLRQLAQQGIYPLPLTPDEQEQELWYQQQLNNQPDPHEEEED